MSDFPYLGNRISLISSSQIRYEGILYTIDTLQGTVTLAQVRSFGTEDRPTERPVAERDEIYDFIVFRGSDIKDIKLCNVQKTYDDPAIVEMGTSTSSGGAPGGPLAAGSRLPQQTQFGAAAGGAAAPAAPGFGLNGAAAAGGSRLPAAAAAPGGPVSAPPAAPPAATSSESALVTGGAIMDYAASAQPSADLMAGSSRSTTPSRRSPTIDQGVQTAAGQQDTRRHQYRDGQRGGGYHGYQRGGGGGGYRPQRGGRRGGRGQSRGTFTVSTRPIKFDDDFDFEEANKKFEELAAQLAKTKITPSASGGGEEENGEPAAGDDVEHEDGEVVDEEPAPCFYNKTKSFFDNISCDAVEKARDGRQRRQDWQKERKQNLETFGVEGTRRPYRRGGFGRGYYNNRGGGGGGYYNRGAGGGYYNNRGGGYYNNRGYRGYYNYSRGYGNRRGGGDNYQSGGRRSRNPENKPAGAEAGAAAEPVQN